MPYVPYEAPQRTPDPPTEEFKSNGVDILKTPPSLL
jgi:hypothetical protein